MEVLELEAETINNELVHIVETSGLEKSKSQRLLEMFTPYFKKMGEIENKIKVLNAENPGKEDVKIAREIRLALKNNRVASEKVKDDSKASILIEGRLIDSLNNVVKNTSKGLELQCEQIEKDAEIKEAARVESIRVERVELLSPFVDDANIFPLGTMTEDQFSTMLSGYKLAYQQKVDAEQKAEAERIAREAAEKLEQERIRQENERLKKEAEEKEKALAAERTEVARLAKIESDKQAALLKAEQERAAKEKAKSDAIILAERKAAADKLAKEQEASRKIAAELQSKKDAELKAQQIAAKAQADKLAAEKKAAKAPKKEKLTTWVNGFVMDAPAGMNEDITVVDILKKFEAFKKWSLGMIEAV